MLRLYPSNKLEHLADLLDAVMRHSQQQSNGSFSSVLAPNTVLVESLGMQHWLNMAMAGRQGIAMNLQFPMPVRFMWQIARQVLGNSMIPEQSSYKREVLTWRIYDLIQSSDVIENPDNLPIEHYFSHLTKSSRNEELSALEVENNEEINQAKKLQFCRSLADVYEQYMLYRPDWLLAWESNRTVSQSQPGISEQDERWQATLWRALVSQQPHHPASLHTMTLEALNQSARKQSWGLHQHVFVFALNTMAPQLVSFLNALATHCEIHIFHLNPCVNYWGDFQSEKQQLRQQITHWLDEQSNNPLLSNLGQQGRDLFNLLQQQPSFEVSAFEAPLPADSDEQQGFDNSLLTHVKQAIFEGRSQPFTQAEPHSQDASVVVVKAHSALRELQGLHDFLLECMSNDPSLQARDILIMCPAIEHYAAFIPTVFSTSRESTSSIKIPCSVADRAPLDNMPEVSAFLTLLDITQSRFEVSAIIEYLRLPAVQKRFALSEQELDIIVRWLSRARVHWGLNASHKQRFVDIQQPSEWNTWAWGLKRLLIGFAQIDEPVMQGDLLTLPDAEGQQTEILGKLCSLLEQLQWHLKALKQPRDIKQWQEYLLTLRQRFFNQDDTNERAITTIERGIGELVNYCEMAEYQGKMSIFVVRDALSHSFTAPDAINQFMTGQVTFCSMLPMRSIPFKVVAMLGLNDGEFPRVSTPFSIDLMQSTPRRLGDRSRRGDDRYLFLESIISARQTLYLSYQSNSIKDNSERQPSLVLREFCDYLQQSFGDPNNPNVTPYRTYTLPLHAFDLAHFDAKQTTVVSSYDQGWLRLAKSMTESPDAPVSPTPHSSGFEDIAASITASELTKALTNPLKYYANRCLGLYLEDNTPELLDSEPFFIDGLSRYQILSALVDVESDSEVDKEKADTESRFEQIIEEFTASGTVPNDVVSKSEYESWFPLIDELRAAFNRYAVENQSLAVQCGAISLNATPSLSVGEEQPEIVNYRVAKMRSEHQLQVRIDQLVASVALVKPIPAKVFCIEKVNGVLKCNTYDFAGIEPDIAESVLTRLCEMYDLISSGPQLFHCELGKVITQHLKTGDDIEISPKLALAWDAVFSPAFGNDKVSLSSVNNDYLSWFFPIIPVLNEDIANILLASYQPIFSDIKKSATNKPKRGTQA